MGRSRSVLRYRRRHRADEPALNREIKRLARRHPRFGYRTRSRPPAASEGWSINIKRVRRLWIELGLRRPVTAAKTPGNYGPKPGASANSCVNQPATIQERRLDLRLHSRPNRRRSSAQVADVGGRIYSGVLGAARGRRRSREPTSGGSWPE